MKLRSIVQAVLVPITYRIIVDTEGGKKHASSTMLQHMSTLFWKSCTN